MCSLGVVVLVQVLFLSKSQTTRRKSSRLNSIFQIGNDLLVLALFLHSRSPLILLHCTFFSFLAMSRVFLSFTSRSKCGILRSNIYRIILFENLFKPRQLRLAVDICNWLRQFYPQPQNSVLSWLRQFYPQPQNSVLSWLRQFYPQPQNSVLSWLRQSYLQPQSSALSSLRLAS